MAVISNCDEGGRCCLAITGELNIYSVAAVQQELLQALESLQQLDVRMAGVEDLDTAGVQLLLLLKREALRKGKQLSFVQHSLAVREVLNLLNLVAELGDPIVIPHDEVERSL